MPWYPDSEQLNELTFFGYETLQCESYTGLLTGLGGY
jgi:hypothetical protein